jgi:uncharacterized protein
MPEFMKYNRRAAGLVLLFLLLLPQMACHGYLIDTSDARRAFLQDNFTRAAEFYSEKLKEQEGERDQLLYLLDSALSYHSAGEFKKSNELFFQAAKLTEQLDAISLTSQAASLLVTDYVLFYKGEDFEKVLIHTYLAINFLMLHQYESALVEARKVNNIIKKLTTDDPEKAYVENAFSIYLAGMIQEAAGDLNDAYIDYKKVYKLVPDFPLLADNLLKVSRDLRFNDDYEQYVEKFEREAPELPYDEMGEVIVLYEAGLSPQKYQFERLLALPKYQRRSYVFNGLDIFIGPERKASTHVLEDVAQTSIDWLDAHIDRIIVKQTAASAAKVAVAVGVGQATDSPILRDVILLFFYATNEADLRSWLTLPASLQVARFWLKPGTYDIRLVPLTNRGSRYSEGYEKTVRNVKVEAGKKVFLNHRTTY